MMEKKLYQTGERLGKAAANIRNEYSRVSKMKSTEATDVEKHRYISCLGGQAGLSGQALILAGGLAKEAVDFVKKTASSQERERYNGVGGIVKDGLKDMKNNFIGSNYGRLHPEDGACLRFFKKK